MSNRPVHTALYLADMADVSTPDGPASAGAYWLDTIHRDVWNRLDEVRDEAHPSDWISETTDAHVPLYSHALWAVFTDLAAWREDVAEYGPFNDMEYGARAALYAIAERLILATLEEAGVL